MFLFFRPRLLVLAPALIALVVVADHEQQSAAGPGGIHLPIYATVRDAGGRLVPGLKEQDFEVLDNGKPTPITAFVQEARPIAVVVALDMSGSMVNAVDRAKAAAEAFLRRLRPVDRAIVASFNDRVVMSPAFTSNQADLIRYVQTGLSYGNGTRLWDAIDGCVTVVKAEPERKVIVVLSDGEDTASRTGGSDVLNRAQDSHVMVYAIGIRNSYRGGPTGQLVTTRPDPFLKKLTSETGGANVEVGETADLNATFTSVIDELQGQYLIGIVPVADGKAHKLEVRIKVPGATVRARKNYKTAKTGAVGGAS